MNWQAIIEFLGGASLFSALLGYLGKHAIDSYSAGRLEAYKSELEASSSERRDALTRKRDVYGRVSNAMRVFQASGKPASDEERSAFLLAFDQAYLWASEEAAQALVRFLELSVRHTREPDTVSNDEFKDAYRDCLTAMRQNCGFPETKVRYPVVTFR